VYSIHSKHEFSRSSLLSKYHRLEGTYLGAILYTPVRKVGFPAPIMTKLEPAQQGYFEGFYTGFNLNQTINTETNDGNSVTFLSKIGL
jgi:hypothetical protein